MYAPALLPILQLQNQSFDNPNLDPLNLSQVQVSESILRPQNTFKSLYETIIHQFLESP